MSRAFSVAGRHRVDVMIEAFNVLNGVNVIAVNNVFGTSAPRTTFGQPTVVGDARQIQLGIRWNF